MWDLRACRGCLSTKSKLEKYNEHTKKIYMCITGLTIDEADGYPNYFCIECVAFMKKVLSFRRKMRRAFYVMKEIMLKKRRVTYFDIMTVDRRRTNLRSTIGYWKPRFTGFYTINNEEEGEDNVISTDSVPTIENVIQATDNVEPTIDSETEKRQLIQYRPTTNGNIRHIIDIKPTVEIPAIESVLEKDNEEEAVKDDDDDDDQNNEDTAEPTEDIAEEIDLTNVFENFVDETNDSDYSLPDEYPKKKIQRSKELKPQHIVPTKLIKSTIRMACQMLSMCEIEIATPKKQMEIFNIRKQMPPYSTAIYKCGICVTIFYSIEHLRAHINKHNNTLTHTHMCRVCFLKFSSEKLLEIHHAENHKYIYKCKECNGRLIYTLADLIKHGALHVKSKTQETENNMEGYKIIQVSNEDMYLKMAHGDSTFECAQCYMKFDTVNLLNTHERKHKKWTALSLQCDICSTWHQTRRLLEKHMALWHLHKYKCNYCSEILFNKMEAKYHSLRKHKGVKSIKCKYCDKMIHTIGLHIHNYRYHYTQTYVHDCVVCGLVFPSAIKLYAHQFQVHQLIYTNDLSIGDEEARCKVCNVQFLSVDSYKMHAMKRRHEDAQFFENACTKCQKLFDTDEEYNQHMTTYHQQSKYPRKCSYCDQVCNTTGSFFKHQIKKHGDKPTEYINTPKLCELCGATVFLMRNHMRLHNEELIKFECQYCTPVRELKNWKNLVRHLMAKHTPLPYICTICNQAFSGRQECYDHILKLHAPVMPFKCGYCLRQFSHVKYLRDHVRKIHNVTIKKDPQFTAVIKQNLLVYPHMKLNLSLVKPNVLKIIRIKLSDYTHTKIEKLVDPSDYIITDKPDLVVDEKAPKKRKIKWDFDDLDKDVVVTRQIRITTTKEDVTKNIKRKKDSPKKEKVRKDMIKEEVIQDDTDLIYDTGETCDNVEICDSGEQIHDSGELMHDSAWITDDKGEIIKEDSDGNLIINEELKVFEENGDKFVFINGVVYKVETDD